MTYLQAFAVIREQLERVKASNPQAPITIVAEGSQAMDISRVALPVFNPRGRLDAGTWGTMGVGLGYAVAARLASKGMYAVNFVTESPPYKVKYLYTC